MVAPRIAAFEAAMMQKSLPVMPSNTSLEICIRRYILGQTQVVLTWLRLDVKKG